MSVTIRIGTRGSQLALWQANAVSKQLSERGYRPEIVLFGREPSPATRKVLDACLILHAEHQMNASTFAARVTGSTLWYSSSIPILRLGFTDDIRLILWRSPEQ